MTGEREYNSAGMASLVFCITTGPKLWTNIHHCHIIHNISKLVNLILQMQYTVMNPFKTAINLKPSLLSRCCHLNPMAIEGLWLSLKSELPTIRVKVSVSCCLTNTSQGSKFYTNVVQVSPEYVCIHSSVCVCMCTCTSVPKSGNQ